MTTATQYQEWEAKKATQELLANVLRATNPHLIPGNDRVTAAKNIRIELKTAFPGVKFSVRGESFSGGDSIRVSWTDGPSADQVDAIIKKYKAGSFDGYTDCYNYEPSTWRDAFGDAKYVSTSREYSDQYIQAVRDQLVTRYGTLDGVPCPTVEDYRAGRLWSNRTWEHLFREALYNGAA